jgi:hypothetical protein
MSESAKAMLAAIVGGTPSEWRDVFVGHCCDPWSGPSSTEADLGDLSWLWGAAPQLERLVLEGRTQLGDIIAPQLRQFAVRTLVLDKAVLSSIASASWDELDTLVVCSYDGCRAPADLDQLQPIFDGVGLKRLKRLGLMGFADEVWSQITRASILPQLESLALGVPSWVALPDRKARRDEDLKELAAAFSHLRLGFYDPSVEWPAEMRDKLLLV